MDFYGTVADADAYLAARGFIAWATASTPDKEAALLIASEYLDANYGSQFGGETVVGRQERQWPRKYAYDIYLNLLPSTEVPREVEQATYQLAYRQATNPGSLDVDFNASEVISKATVFGAVSVEFGGSGSLSDSQSVFPVVDGILYPLLTAQGSGFSSLSGSRVRV